MKAVVLGATGAVGRELVASLASQLHISDVYAVTRKAPSTSDKDKWINETFPSLIEGSNSRKVKVVEMDWEAFSNRELSSASDEDYNAGGGDNDGKNLFAGATYVSWALGTTRANAGSAKAFERIDLDYFRAAVSAAKKESSVKHFAVVSSQGANPKSWFLYMKVKGKIEDCVRKAAFDRVSIYRPGLLNRGDKLRFNEKIAVKLMKSTPVSAVANFMAFHSKEEKEGGDTTTPIIKVYEDKEIRQSTIS